MLPAMTMAAVLHVNGNFVSKSAIARHLKMLQTSSPSYPILASIDLARKFAATEAKSTITESLQRIRSFLRENHLVESDDPFKWVWHDHTGTYSGYDLYQHLESQGIYAEMADIHHVVLFFSLHTTQTDLAQLQKAIDALKIPKRASIDRGVSISNDALTGNGSLRNESFKTVAFTRDMFHHPIESRFIEDAIGKRCAESVIPYPPGVALLFPGETITKDHCDAIRNLRACHAHVQGIEDSTLQKINVFIEE
jgi:arginine/lysine/ornithine decarboxylase